MAAPNPALLLSIHDAALMLGLTEKALRRQVERGRVPHRRLGRRVLFVKAEMEEWLHRLPGVRLEEIEEMREWTR